MNIKIPQIVIPNFRFQMKEEVEKISRSSPYLQGLPYSIIKAAPEPTFWQRTKETISKLFEPVTTAITGLTPRERAEVVPIQAKFRMPFEPEYKPLPWARDSILNVAMVPGRIISRGWEGFTQMGLTIEQTAIDLYHITTKPAKELPPPISVARIGGLTEPTGLIRGFNNSLNEFEILQKENNSRNEPLKTFVNTQLAYYKHLAPSVADFLIAGDLMNLALQKSLTPLGERAARVKAAEELGYPRTIQEAQTAFITIAHETSELGRVGVKNRTMFERAKNAYTLLKTKGVPSPIEIRTVPPIRNIVQNLTRKAFEREIPLEAAGAIRPPAGYLPGYALIEPKPAFGLKGLTIEPIKPVGRAIIPKTAAEAKASGQSFDEWVKGQGDVLYRATDSKTGYAELGKGVYGADKPEFAKLFGKNIEELVIDPKAKIITEGSPEFESLHRAVTPRDDYKMNPDLARKTALARGIDGIKGLDPDTGTVIFNDKMFKTRSQLKAEWDKVKPEGIKEVGAEIVPKEEAKLREIYNKELAEITEEGERAIFKDIKGLGGIKTDLTLKEEMSDLPIDILRTDGVMPDEMVDMLNNRGYNLQSTDELFEMIRAIRSMPSRYKPAETTLERNIKAVRSIRTKMPKETLPPDMQKVADKIIKEATVGRVIPPKRVIERVTGIKPEERMITRPETILLKARIRAEAKGAKMGISGYKREVVFLERIEREIAKELQKPKGLQRSVISFVKQLGEFNQTVMNEIKAELGIEKTLKEMNLEELGAFTKKLKERLRFKFEKGYRPSVETKEKLKLAETPKPKLNEADYKKNRELAKETKIGIIKGIGKGIEKIGITLEKTLTPISTRFENIDPTLKYALRRFEFDAMNFIKKDQESVVPYLKKIKIGIFRKIAKEDFADLDLALKNGDADKITKINKKYGIEKEYDKVRNTLDDIYDRANKVGFDIGYQKDYWPRVIKDTNGFLEYFGKQEYWSILNEAIQRKEMDLGRYLTNEEKANLINIMIRGYQGGQITLSRTGSMKGRVIDLVTAELNQFYYDSPTSLVKYINEVDDKIAARKFFGKGNKAEGFNNIENSIGAYTTDLLAKGKITPKQELELRAMLNARFNPKGTHGIIGLYKNLAYMDVMGSFLNAVTQLGDQTWAIYEAGLWKTIKADIKGLAGKSEITKESLGIEANKIAQEFSDSGKMAKKVDGLFTLTGLNKIDRLGKEALVNAAIEKYRKLAEKPSLKFLKKLNDIFGKETEQILTDLKGGEITENIRFLVFNKLLDFHPVALSEMPEMYLKGGNGRIFYMLKSYTLKQYDIFRREAFREIRKGNYWKGIRNLLYLAMMVIITNGMADEIKDLLTHRKTKLSDRVIDQLAMLAGFSRYTVNRISETGLGTALVEQITPPTNFIDNLSKDLLKMYKDFDESANINKLRTVQDIPLIGKFYYWWFGKGAENTKKYAPKEEGVEVPDIEIPGIKIPSIEIPSISIPNISL